MTTFTLTRPDDWHVHLRDGDVLQDTVRDISRYNGRALIMPKTYYNAALRAHDLAK